MPDHVMSIYVPGLDASLPITRHILLLHHCLARTGPGGCIYTAFDNANAFEQFAHVLFSHNLDILFYRSSGSFSYAIADLLFHKDPNLFGYIGPSSQFRDAFTYDPAL